MPGTASLSSVCPVRTEDSEGSGSSTVLRTRHRRRRRDLSGCPGVYTASCTDTGGERSRGLQSGTAGSAVRTQMNTQHSAEETSLGNVSALRPRWKRPAGKWRWRRRSWTGTWSGGRAIPASCGPNTQICQLRFGWKWRWRSSISSACPWLRSSWWFTMCFSGHPTRSTTSPAPSHPTAPSAPRGLDDYIVLTHARAHTSTHMMEVTAHTWHEAAAGMDGRPDRIQSLGCWGRTEGATAAGMHQCSACRMQVGRGWLLVFLQLYPNTQSWGAFICFGDFLHRIQTHWTCLASRQKRDVLVVFCCFCCSWFSIGMLISLYVRDKMVVPLKVCIHPLTHGRIMSQRAPGHRNVKGPQTERHFAGEPVVVLQLILYWILQETSKTAWDADFSCQTGFTYFTTVAPLGWSVAVAAVELQRSVDSLWGSSVSHVGICCFSRVYLTLNLISFGFGPEDVTLGCMNLRCAFFIIFERVLGKTCQINNC